MSSHISAARTMNVIDLEILIPASPEFIWRFMGDLAAIPQWYEEVVSISFLSTQREGRGTRWRHSTVKGNDVIVEVSAWYDTLGYEYRVVDGTTFSDNQGRIRLQEVSDGTLVRWTFQYELGGVLGGLRNAMRLKRSATNQIQDSLRNLHQLIGQESGGISTHEAKASMQDAPDVYERLSYQPRHPSAFHDVTADDVAGDDDTSLSERHPLFYDLEIEPDAMPVVTDTDTKPNPVVLGSNEELIAKAEPEPDLDDTRPVEVETLLAELSPPDAGLSEAEPEPLVQGQPAQEVIEKPTPLYTETSPSAADDSSDLSVFEIFGLQKPSEARAVAEASSDLVSGYHDERQGQDRRLTPTSDSGLRDLAASWELTDESQQPEGQSTISSSVSGWRRSARRRKTLLRSHT